MVHQVCWASVEEDEAAEEKAEQRQEEEQQQQQRSSHGSRKSRMPYVKKLSRVCWARGKRRRSSSSSRSRMP